MRFGKAFPVALIVGPGRRRPLSVLVLAAAFTGLRWGGLIALRRCDVGLTGGVLHVRRRLAQACRGGLQEGPPKSAASARSLALPRSWGKSYASTSTGMPGRARRVAVSWAEGRATAAK